MEELKASYLTDPEVGDLLIKVQAGGEPNSQFTVRSEILLKKGRIYLSKISRFKDQIMRHIHNSPSKGHSGYHKILHRAKTEFYWPSMKKDIRVYVRECDVCQKNKSENLAPARLLQSLPIPTQGWNDISMDFIEGLPMSRGKLVIFVVVDRFTKYAHFMSTSHPYTTYTIAQLFFNHVFKLHDMLATIIFFYHDPVFLSNF